MEVNRSALWGTWEVVDSFDTRKLFKKELARQREEANNIPSELERLLVVVSEELTV